MNLEQSKTLLAKLNADKEQAFESPNPNISIIQRISLELMRLEEEDRSFFRNFAISLNNDLFDKGASVSGLDLNLFKSARVSSISAENLGKEVLISKVVAKHKEGSNNFVEKEVESISINEIKKTGIEPDWFETLKRMQKGLQEDLKTLKQYFFLRLIYDFSSPYVPIIIHDNRYFQPIRKKLDDEFNITCEIQSIDNLQEEIKQNQFPNKNYIAILLLSTKINDEKRLDNSITSIKKIIDSFHSFVNIAIKNTQEPLTKNDLIRSDQWDPFEDEIRYVTSILLTNAEISNDEEKIIKKIFSHVGSPILEYKVLKGGKSGSRVFEITPKTPTQSKRYIVKFEESNKKRKIKDEHNRFGRHVEICPIQGGYYSKFEQNATVECIQYVYASSDAITKSYSFANIISEKNSSSFTAEETLEKIFTDSLVFDYWDKNTISKGRHKVETLYKRYVETDIFLKNIIQIKGINEADVNNNELYDRFKTIFNHEFDTNQKTCHGDLHSENFFRDEKGFYLIDFGFTGEKHALIDHAMLECSIKFKHIPFYIELEELKKIEEQLLTQDSFKASFNVETNRKDIKKYYNLIKIIRKDSIRHFANQNSTLEYLISLFMITCRLVAYNDLNQLYAISSAEILSKKIMELINSSS